MRTATSNNSRQDRLPTLVELLLDYIRTTPTALGHARDHEDRLRSSDLWDPLMDNTPFYFQRDESIHELELSPRKRGRHVKPRVMYLRTAALVVVPTNLLNQWNSEILKHCEIQLRVLVLDSFTNLPDAVHLAFEYDVSIQFYVCYASKNSCTRLY